MAEAPIIDIVNLEKRYRSKNTDVFALQGINLAINKGDIFGVIGKSGAGKSTLVRCINMLERPTGGSIFFEGKDMCRLSESELRAARRSMGMIFQQFNLLQQRTALQNICFPLEIAGTSKVDAEKRARELLEIVGLSDRADNYPSQLSGGQKRRVAIAGVIAMRPDVLVLDEPTAGLDPAGRDEIFELVRSYHKQSGATILIVSHSMEDIAQVADRLLVMNHAKVLFCDTPREVFSHADEIIAAGLDIPMITKVMLELKKRGHDVDTSVYTVAQAMDALRACKWKEAAHEC